MTATVRGVEAIRVACPLGERAHGSARGRVRERQSMLVRLTTVLLVVALVPALVTWLPGLVFRG